MSCKCVQLFLYPCLKKIIRKLNSTEKLPGIVTDGIHSFESKVEVRFVWLPEICFVIAIVYTNARDEAHRDIKMLFPYQGINIS